MHWNVKDFRQHFPFFNNNEQIVYLDNAATTQKNIETINKLNEFYEYYNANVHRGVHYLSAKATELFEKSRIILQQYINAKYDHEIIFTKGTTEAINLVAHSYIEKFCKAGDNIITTPIEHHSNFVPWQLAAERKELELRLIPFDIDEYRLNLDVYRNLIDKNTKIVAITQVSNVLGIETPLKEIIEIAHSKNVPVLVDAAQAFPHLQIDVQILDVDFLALSAHKFFGPTGMGILYGKEKWLDAMPPYQSGGEMIDNVTIENTTFNELPFKFEAGTPNFADAIAWGATIDFINQLDRGQMFAYEEKLWNYAYQKLTKLPFVKIFALPDQKHYGAISFIIENIHSYDVASFLDELKIAVRVGHHCAQPLMNLLNVNSTIRASIAPYNTIEEIDRLVEGLNIVYKFFIRN
ncbi:MAG: cysteine desulfurase [Bacteroidales bacterium]|jgi:cysteine desulfurase/selenocysteine lyase|nr:cysteine desulfurase [Bacteroidales bacterium]HOB78012.1 cysteine desulfurase [Bacteroidales bacterium]HPZ61481.1 cysteine desulfurase [Bacteroidales bacterium]HQD58931.1 cysteine desulfurase [Bacteroidales bacterium]